jgi:hypothetical protein
MPLNKTAFKQGLKGLLVDMASRTDNTPQGNAQTQDDYVNGLADLLYDFFTSATVTGNVTTNGSATTQAGPLLNGRIQ